MRPTVTHTHRSRNLTTRPISYSSFFTLRNTCTKSKIHTEKSLLWYNYVNVVSTQRTMANTPPSQLAHSCIREHREYVPLHSKDKHRSFDGCALGMSNLGDSLRLDLILPVLKYCSPSTLLRFENANKVSNLCLLKPHLTVVRHISRILHLRRQVSRHTLDRFMFC